MGAVRKHSPKQLLADYDREADVLYFTSGPSVPGYGDEGPGDVILRYSLADGAPIGATVIGFAECGWGGRTDVLARVVSKHLGVSDEAVVSALKALELQR